MKCPQCEGQGFVHDTMETTKRCPTCGGEEWFCGKSLMSSGFRGTFVQWYDKPHTAVIRLPGGVVCVDMSDVVEA